MSSDKHPAEQHETKRSSAKFRYKQMENLDAVFNYIAMLNKGLKGRHLSFGKDEDLVDISLPDDVTLSISAESKKSKGKLEIGISWSLPEEESLSAIDDAGDGDKVREAQEKAEKKRLKAALKAEKKAREKAEKAKAKAEKRAIEEAEEAGKAEKARLKAEKKAAEAAAKQARKAERKEKSAAAPASASAKGSRQATAGGKAKPAAKKNKTGAKKAKKATRKRTTQAKKPANRSKPARKSRV